MLNDSGHLGQVRVLAHSQGNVVTGEALRLASENFVHTYIASQAAISASCYQGGLPQPDYYDHIPEVRLNYPETGLPYLAGVTDKAQNLFSYFNAQDWALVGALEVAWNDNNCRRPASLYSLDSGGTMVYVYEGPDDNYDVNASPLPSRFYYYIDIDGSHLDGDDLTFPEDTYEIFSFAAEAWTRPLGVQPSMNDFEEFNLDANGLNYGEKHYGHSRQFLSNIVDEDRYWREVMTNAILSDLTPGQPQ